MGQLSLVPAEPAEPAIRHRLCNTDVTLEGRPAVIEEYDNNVATVRTLDGFLEYQYSWSVVKRTVEFEEGQFFIIMRR